MHHFNLPAGSKSWQLLNTFGIGITSAPCMIEGQFEASNELDVGNFELCVATDGYIQHWSRANHALGPWVQGDVYGGNVSRVLALVEGSFGFNLELIVERTDSYPVLLARRHRLERGAVWIGGVSATTTAMGKRTTRCGIPAVELGS